ncbi:Ycf51 family protein [Oxynema sp. CENA135]|jgi:hypothetical protein|uniref:DUF2518 family protein n=1 Tax=Oxynema aestuarii AP17 TaxID=2064643 RepID=A0A6H1U100_9CYAN|nr:MULTISPECIES: Ycf51 family protein [Oxynema]MBK4732520.1 Ycf51 family protein [Oxynema sp. CENA135]QIZ71693.1 DUF2518 family protein [Oxynema aestuarii AP17]RMH78165.1 MAG: hypothetical protein D6680_02950 [Cyanobacteria bacterium J007]
MPTTEEFLTASAWSAALAGVLALLAIAAFLFKWGIRFRLVGATGFTIVLTAGLFALGLVPISRVEIPGAVRFTVVYDNGAEQATIAVPPTISRSELEATLQQAASDLFSPGRMSQGTDDLRIRARAIVHPREGVSKPLYIGEVRRSLFVRDDENMTVEIDDRKLAELPKSPAS